MESRGTILGATFACILYGLCCRRHVGGEGQEEIEEESGVLREGG